MIDDVIVESPLQIKDTVNNVLVDILRTAISVKNLQSKNELRNYYDTYLKEGFSEGFKNNFDALNFADYLKLQQDYRCRVIANFIERDFWITKFYKSSKN